MINIGIIVSSWHYFMDPFKLQPLHELYFATFLQDRFQDEVNVDVIDMREIRKLSDQIDQQSIERFVPEKDLYFYWVMKAADYFEVLLTVEVLKKLYPESKHIAGGTHIQHYFDDACQYFDASISGPGEEPMADAVTRFQNNIELPNAYNDSWKESSYNDYPIAKREYLARNAIVNNTLFTKYDSLPGTSVLLQRGCNFNCTYCVYNVPNTIQARSSENIKEEINYLKSTYRIKAINLRDEIAIPTKSKVAIPFLEAIKQCDVTWRGQTRVGSPRDVIQLARESGCVELAIGVETASPQVLKLIDKGQTMPMVKEFIDYCREFDIKVKMCLILGLPGEPLDILDVTKNYIDEVRPDYVAVSGFCPVPGSVIYKKQEYFGIKNIDKDLRKHAHLMFRFSGEQDEHGVPFEYESQNQWGKTFTRDEIINNVKELQEFCREQDMVY